MAVHDIGVVDIYIVSSIGAADAERIVAVTGKRRRLGAQQTVERLNWGVTLAIAGTGAALAGPASKQKARATRLHKALGQALQLLGLHTGHAPAEGWDFAGPHQVLLPAGESAPLTTECARLGFRSPGDAVWYGTRSLWLFYRWAAAARAHWEAHPEATRHRPDRLVMAWAEAMVGTYAAVVEAQVPKSPTTESPFIKFCEEMRVHMMRRVPSSSDPALEAFRGTLKRVRPAAMAAFITRHFKHPPRRIGRSSVSNSYRRIRPP